MKHLFTPEMRAQLAASRVIATVTVENVEDAKPLAEALLAGGIRAVEVTMRTPVALRVLQVIAENYSEMLVMAGTVITPTQVRQVQDAGASCAVAPGMNARVVQAAVDARLPFAPGIATPSEIEQALEFDCDILKLFPAEPMGGLKYLKSMQAPYAHLGLQFIPLGGLTAENAEDYLQEDIILAVGGSWIASASAILSGDWAGITHRAATAMQQP
ncbi:MAG: bifunctional 4-hydroxy-2-oxoglutarate aldolase/2-dehydro-3-deoxy-phosphogluconate aldolase [Coraliomargarita sp.]|nr:bifunctional 4-hydroxy-2-oxoglutarate aldolase/2-dehydro-3-deoxy-phosphogluconate aldolase [Coraliomargarita sp.]